MKRGVAIALLLGATPGWAQTSNGREPPLLPLRFMENVSEYCRLSRERDGIADLKCLRLAGPDGPVLSIGGEAKWKLETFDPVAFGQGGDVVTYPLQRLLLHGDLRLSKRVRVFAQLGHHARFGSDAAPRAVDENGVDVQQAFVDVNWRRGPDDGLAVRLGRQEFGFGSARFIGVREGANIRLSFDAALISWQSPNRFRLEAFAGRPVAVRRGSFNDPGDPDRRFWGVHSTIRLAGNGSFPESPGDRHVSLDLYYYGLSDDAARLAGAIARERRHNVAARLFGRSGGFDLDWEAQVQRGTLGAAAIRAWTVASDTGWTFADMPLSPRIGVRADIASGDGDPVDGVVRGLNPLFASPAYFSEAALVGPVNLVSLNPYLTLSPPGGIRVQAGWNMLWKQRVADFFYRPNAIPVQGSAGGARRAGSQFWMGASMPVRRGISLGGSLVWFNAGPAIRQGGGRDVGYASASIKVQF